MHMVISYVKRGSLWSYYISLQRKIANQLVPLWYQERSLKKEDGAQKQDDKAYRSLVGSLLYLIAIHPDIVFVVNYLSRFIQSPSQIHFVAVKRVLRYLKGTVEFGIYFVKFSSIKLVGFSNNDWAESDNEMMSN